ncbi:MAG: hypothetical protein RAK22_01690 [Nanoarchaeota archaeon]|nr:hypothetical protein [Nanoarchaeota archaeon]
MDVSAFDVAADIKNLYDHTGKLKALQSLLDYKKLSISMERSEDGSIKIKTVHPIRIYAKDIYNILLRLNFVQYVDLRIDFTQGDQQKNVSKRFGTNEDIDEIIEDLLGLPHDRIIDIVIDTEAFKIVETPEGTGDDINIIVKKGNSKAFFKSLVTYLFPIITISVESSAKMDILFQKDNEGEIVVDVSPVVDGVMLGIKSIKVKIL